MSMEWCSDVWGACQEGGQERDQPSDTVVQCGGIQGPEQAPITEREEALLTRGMENKFRYP